SCARSRRRTIRASSRRASRCSATWFAAGGRRRSIVCSAAGSRTWRCARCTKATATRWPRGGRTSTCRPRSRSARRRIRTAGSWTSRPCSPRPKICSRARARSHVGEPVHSTRSRTHSCCKLLCGVTGPDDSGELREELERVTQLLDLLMRQGPRLTWVMDRDLRIVSTGGAVEAMLGYAVDRWIGSTLYDVQQADGVVNKSIEAHLRALEGEVSTYSNLYRDKQLQVTV